MPAPISRDYFISRTGTEADKALAKAIAAIIREAGYETWLQDEDFGHASFMARMAQGFDSGARTIALLSATYQDSEYCQKEYEVALAGDPRNIQERLIVLRVEDCAPKGMLRDLAYTDLVEILGLSDPAQREQLLRRAIRVLVGAELGQSGGDFINLYRHTQQILHPEIAPVPGFTGRAAELAALKAALWNGSAAALVGSPAATALSGLGGVGKSVLAREYAWYERENYRGVWWLRAEKRETLLDDHGGPWAAPRCQKIHELGEKRLASLHGRFPGKFPEGAPRRSNRHHAFLPPSLRKHALFRLRPCS